MTRTELIAAWTKAEAAYVAMPTQENWLRANEAYRAVLKASVR